MPSYDKAAECFAENTRRIDANKDPVGWNLNNGLRMLAESLAEDSRKIRGMESAVYAIESRR